jgi:hypothetical protein
MNLTWDPVIRHTLEISIIALDPVDYIVLEHPPAPTSPVHPYPSVGRLAMSVGEVLSV